MKRLLTIFLIAVIGKMTFASSDIMPLIVTNKTGAPLINIVGEVIEGSESHLTMNKNTTVEPGQSKEIGRYIEKMPSSEPVVLLFRDDEGDRVSVTGHKGEMSVMTNFPLDTYVWLVYSQIGNSFQLTLSQ